MRSHLGVFLSALLCAAPVLSSDYRPFPRCERLYRNFVDSHMVDLDDYVDDFPMEQYSVHSVPKLGLVFVDDIGDYIKEILKSGQAWEPEHITLMEKYVRKGSTVVDMGAHIGTITIPAARIVGNSGRVIAFEPQPKIFRELNHNLMLNGIKNVETFRLAVGEHRGVAQLGVLATGNEGGTRLNSQNLSGEMVDVVTLDSFNLDDVSLIKIDVEGWEDEALRGGKNTIMRNRPVIVIEIQGGTNYERAPQSVKDKIDAPDALIESFDYDVSQFSLDYVAIPRVKSEL